MTGKDTLLSELNRLKISEIEAKYHAREQLNETLRLKEKNEKSVRLIKKYKLLFAGLAGTVVLIIIIFVLYLWFRKSKTVNN